MTDLEKQIEIKRERADAFSRVRTAPPPEEKKEVNFFSANTAVSSSISRELKEFTSYQPADISSLYKEIEEKKAPQPAAQPAPAPKPQPQPKAKPFEDAFDNITRMPAGDTSFEIPVPKEYQGEKFGIKINLRGKLVILVASVAMLMLMFLAIFNAVVIHGLNKDIADTSSRMELEQQVLVYWEDKYNDAIDDMGKWAANEGYSEIPPENVIEFSIIEKAAIDAVKEKSNWFDAFCNFVYHLFGGK